MYGKFYPLIFDCDMYLGTTLNDSAFLSEYGKGDSMRVTHSLLIMEGYHVRFKRRSYDVVYSGWSIAREVDKKKKDK